MNFVDIIIIVCLVIGALIGFKKGVIKTAVQLIGTVALIIVAYTFKDILANFLMSKLPFFNFGGVFSGISSINILFYELISFVVLFILLYCVLNILISLSGIIEKLLEATVILAIPSKILGAILGAIEGLVFAFMLIFVMYQTNLTTEYVEDSNMGIVLLERTPFIGQVMAKTTLAMEDIHELIKEADKRGNKANKDELNLQVLSTLIHYNIVSKETAEQLIKDNKIELKNAKFS